MSETWYGPARNMDHVNADVTDLNCQQTIRILYLTHGLPKEFASRALKITTVCEMGEDFTLPNGSFTLCQLVRRLNKATCVWLASERGDFMGQWFWREESVDEQGDRYLNLHCLSKDVNAHDLTGAADAYIKYLELQKQREAKQ